MKIIAKKIDYIKCDSLGNTVFRFDSLLTRVFCGLFLDYFIVKNILSTPEDFHLRPTGYFSRFSNRHNAFFKNKK